MSEKNQLCLVEVVICRGHKQTSFTMKWALKHDLRRIVKSHAQIGNFLTIVGNNTSIVSADLTIEIEAISDTGVCLFEKAVFPVNTIVETPNSKNGFLGRASAQVEYIKLSIIEAPLIMITAVIHWQVKVIQEQEKSNCCHGRKFHEKHGILPLTPTGSTEWFDISLMETISIIASNPELPPIEVFLEGSPDQIVIFRNTPVIPIAFQNTVCLTPKLFARYLRLSGKCSQNTQVLFWFQAQL